MASAIGRSVTMSHKGPWALPRLACAAELAGQIVARQSASTRGFPPVFGGRVHAVGVDVGHPHSVGPTGSGLRGGAQDDLVDVDLVGLFDGEADRPGHGVGGQRDLIPHPLHLLAPGGVGNRVGEVGGDEAR